MVSVELNGTEWDAAYVETTPDDRYRSFTRGVQPVFRVQFVCRVRPVRRSLFRSRDPSFGQVYALESRIFLSLDLHGSSLLIIRNENWRRYCWYTRDQVSSIEYELDEKLDRISVKTSNLEFSSFFLIL